MTRNPDSDVPRSSLADVVSSPGLVEEAGNEAVREGGGFMSPSMFTGLVFEGV